MNHECYDFLLSTNRPTFFIKISVKYLVKFLPYWFLIMSQIPLDIMLFYVFFQLSFSHNPLLQFHAIILFQVIITIIFFTCHWCEVEMLSRWLWINAIYVSRTSWPMPGKSHVAFAIKYFMWNVSHCLQSIWCLYKITMRHGIAPTV